MKVLQTVAVAIGLLTLFASCKSTSAQMKGLSNKETRNEIMNAIANDSIMSQEMIGAMMNSQRRQQYDVWNDKDHDWKPANDGNDTKYDW